MKRLSLQWRITLMTVLLIGITCVAMNLLLCSSGVYLSLIHISPRRTTTAGVTTSQSLTRPRTM